MEARSDPNRKDSELIEMEDGSEAPSKNFDASSEAESTGAENSGEEKAEEEREEETEHVRTSNRKECKPNSA